MKTLHLSGERSNNDFSHFIYSAACLPPLSRSFVQFTWSARVNLCFATSMTHNISTSIKWSHESLCRFSCCPEEQQSVLRGGIMAQHSHREQVVSKALKFVSLLRRTRRHCSCVCLKLKLMSCHVISYESHLY